MKALNQVLIHKAKVCQLDLVLAASQNDKLVWQWSSGAGESFAGI